MRYPKHTACAGLALALVALVLGSPSRTATAATITIVNIDGAGEGLNDPTPAAPVGGNNGTTLGQQRLNVFLQAASIWGNLLPSSVTIRVQASFDPLTCNSSSGVLGAASTIDVARNFPNAPVAGTWYHVALANKLAGVDLQPARNDIQAFFNSSINGNVACLGGRTWYYGFDGNEGANIELLPVVLHELAHGLGFSTFANESSGALLSGVPDVFTRFMLDTDTGLTWNQMNDAQRQASAVNSLGLVWNGAAVTTMAPILLGPRPRLLVSAPPAIAGSYEVGTASFGAALTTTGVTGMVVLANDGSGTSSDACEPIQNNVVGKIVLVDRGTCTFAAKAASAQNAGAIGVIIVNNVVASTPPSLGGTDPSVVIPAVGITLADGNAIKAQLGGGVTATLGLDATQLAGADAARRVYLYAPNPVESGSSLSHFDRSANPDLLMEPALSASLSNGVDMTRYLFEDIGWLPRTTDAFDADAARVRLWGAAPNPFTTDTAVRFDLPHAERVDLAIYDVAGRLVRRVAPGVYFSGLQSSAGRDPQRLVRLR